MALIPKLNPPHLHSKLPAFIKEEGKDISLVVPFTLNRSVSTKQFKTLSIIIKSVQNNIVKFQGTSLRYYYNYFTNSYNAVFNIVQKSNFPEVGQYYKVQIACVDDVSQPDTPIVGFYSTVGIIKCTSKPTVTFKDVDSAKHYYEYTGVYSQKGGDITEKVYSYRFNLYDAEGNLIETSGDCIHNASKDVELYESTDSWLVSQTLNPSQRYKLEYLIQTNNGYSDSSTQWIERVDSSFNIPIDLASKMCYDNGYIQLTLKGNGPVSIDSSFILLRSSSTTNFEVWSEITRFQLIQNSILEPLTIKDYTAEQGITYKYAIQASDLDGAFLGRTEYNHALVLCDFEDAFLYDGERQLKIRFNPQISSFKSTILESKVDTIGGKYPFVFRNGNVEYKEFSIAGLLSVLGDEAEEFLTGLLYPDEVRTHTPSMREEHVSEMGTWLTSNNFKREREFKMKALAWLTDGKPKLFKSPAEGNFIVRLMNTSLSPNDTLGRMLHTFNCSACEIAEFNYKNLKEYGLAIKDYIETRALTEVVINLNEKEQTQEGKIEIDIPKAYKASVFLPSQSKFYFSLLSEWEQGRLREEDTDESGAYVFPEWMLKKDPLVYFQSSSISPEETAYLKYSYYNSASEQEGINDEPAI